MGWGKYENLIPPHLALFKFFNAMKIKIILNKRSGVGIEVTRRLYF